MNSTVNVLKLGADIDIYKQGFEPYNVNDYIPDESIASELFVSSQEYVKRQLTYPNTAKFPIIDWSAAREKNLYTISSNVEAKNAFGTSEEIPYSITFLISDEHQKIVYFILNGNVIVNKVDSLDIPKRKEVLDKEKSNKTLEKSEINLIDGELGEYGKTVTLDGKDYINYYVPQGNYTIKNNGKMCTIFIAKDEYYKNSDGYMQNDIVNTIRFTEYEETANITINEGEHIELTINASVTLKKLD